MTTPQLLKTREDAYKAKLTEESYKLLKDGLTQQETNKAIDIILQNESGYVPGTFNPEIEINKTVRNIWAFLGLGALILLIKPRTVIGIGKNRWKVNFYRKWIYFVLIFFPLYIVIPLIINRLS